jgi:hypothetical protein
VTIGLRLSRGEEVDTCQPISQSCYGAGVVPATPPNASKSHSTKIGSSSATQSSGGLQSWSLLAHNGGPSSPTSRAGMFWDKSKGLATLPAREQLLVTEGRYGIEWGGQHEQSAKGY